MKSDIWGGYYNEKGKFIYGKVPEWVLRKREKEEYEAAAMAQNNPFAEFNEDRDADGVLRDDDEADNVAGGVSEACLLDEGLMGPPTTAGASSSSSSSGGAGGKI